MKKTSIILVLCSTLFAHTLRADEAESIQTNIAFGTLQGNVSYAYDAAGNRISRTIVLQQSMMRAMSMPDFDSDETWEEEKPFVDFLNDLQVKIFPNPTRGQLAIEITGADGENVQITVFSARGELLLTKQATASARTAVDLSAFSTGNYILVLTINGTNQQYKIVKL
jgi:hypothetical protein